MSLRADFSVIAQWVETGARVLDLGCGDGTLLAYLAEERGARGYGLEIDPQAVNRCIARGVNVIQADLDAGLSQFESNSFDLVLLAQALQVVQRPDHLLDEMLRVGQRGVVTFPNFGHWRCRKQLLFNGRMPVSDLLPNGWYNTPNIHLCTVADFENLCQQRNILITRRSVVDRQHRATAGARLWPNLMGETAMYEVQRNTPERNR